MLQYKVEDGIMLERIKIILMKQKEVELQKQKSIRKQIDDLHKKQNSEEFREIDQKLSNLENKIYNIQTHFFKRILNGNLLTELYQDYFETSHLKMKKLNEYSNQIEKLLEELYNLAHNEVLIENEIEKIKNATTLEELNLTEEKAQELLNNIIPSNQQTIIQKVFSDVLLINPKTKDDIYKINQKLHQTNSSPYVLEMQKIDSKELMNQLLELGIAIEEDKLEFLNELNTYIKDLSNSNIPNIELIDRTDKLDDYYYSEVEQALNNIKRYQNPSSIAVSEIKTLSILVSIAKANKKEQINKK